MTDTIEAAPPPRSVEEVKALLESTEKGGVRNSIHNCLTVFQYDPVLSGAVAKNLLTERIDLLKPIGRKRRTGSKAMTDTDMKYIRLYLEKTYGLTSEKKIADAADLAADANSYHPIRELRNKTFELEVSLRRYNESLRYYTSSALKEADELTKAANLQLQQSETGIAEYIQSITTAREIRRGYIETVYQYNIAALEYELFK